VAWVWVVVAIAIVVALAVTTWALLTRRRVRTAWLRRRFGPEYERTLARYEDRAEAEDELTQRVERRQQLEIRPLMSASQGRYLNSWREIQAQFVDSPEAAVAAADGLIVAAMRERGYPIEDFEQRAADVSVDHPLVVEHYRAAHVIAERCARHEASTEDLRQAMQHYRVLFDDLVETRGDEPPSDEVGRAGAQTTTTNERKVRR
jgi:hypothetical protein